MVILRIGEDMLSKDEKNKIYSTLKIANNAPPEIWLESLKESYNRGNKQALLAAINICAYNKIIMPNWVAENCINAIELFGSLEAKTLDEAFDVKLKKGTRASAIKDSHKYGWVIFEVTQLLNEGGLPIDMELFEKISVLLEEDEGVVFSPEKISKLYYSTEKDKKALLKNLSN